VIMRRDRAIPDQASRRPCEQASSTDTSPR
jgi:hypothetical protein